jgi:hypothetical protein
MSFFNQEDEVRVFPCHGCRRPISSTSESCRYCNIPISEEQKIAAIEGWDEETRGQDVEFHRNIALVGAIIFLVGIGLLTMSIVTVYSGTGGFFVWSPILAVVGFGQVMYGVFGMRKAKRR